jgi:predicted  nucleic acid-binding Zn-ribbon protein
MKKIILLAGAVVVASFVMVNSVFAEDLSDTKKATIVANCATSQSTLQRISRSDISTRISRGRNYDQILKLLYAMNARVASNNITEPKLADITKRFEDKLTSFRNRYNSYNSDLKNTLETDCKSKPEDFYKDLTRARIRRETLNETIGELDDLINGYQAAIKEISK